MGKITFRRNFTQEVNARTTLDVYSTREQPRELKELKEAHKQPEFWTNSMRNIRHLFSSRTQFVMLRSAFKRIPLCNVK